GCRKEIAGKAFLIAACPAHITNIFLVPFSKSLHAKPTACYCILVFAIGSIHPRSAWNMPARRRQFLINDLCVRLLNFQLFPCATFMMALTAGFGWQRRSNSRG